MSKKLKEKAPDKTAEPKIERRGGYHGGGRKPKPYATKQIHVDMAVDLTAAMRAAGVRNKTMYIHKVVAADLQQRDLPPKVAAKLEKLIPLLK